MIRWKRVSIKSCLKGIAPVWKLHTHVKFLSWSRDQKLNPFIAWTDKNFVQPAHNVFLPHIELCLAQMFRTLASKTWGRFFGATFH